MNVATKTKIKDWFIITRIRILNFIKEHKYVSAFIGVLLLSIVVALIVRAADGDYIKDISVSTTGSGRGISVKTEDCQYVSGSIMLDYHAMFSSSHSFSA